MLKIWFFHWWRLTFILLLDFQRLMSLTVEHILWKNVYFKTQFQKCFELCVFINPYSCYYYISWIDSKYVKWRTWVSYVCNPKVKKSEKTEQIHLLNIFQSNKKNTYGDCSFEIRFFQDSNLQQISVHLIWTCDSSFKYQHTKNQHIWFHFVNNPFKNIISIFC